MNKKSMRIILTLGMPGLIVVTVICLILSTQISTKRVFREHAQDIMRNTASCTIDKARSHLTPARDAALLTSALAVNNIVTSRDVSQMEHYFYEQLLINSQFSNIYYGTLDGEFIMASRLESDMFLSKNISIRDGIRDVRFKEMDFSFQAVREYEDQQDNYDPRVRPWYTKAVEEGELIWTSPYIFFTSKNPGITTASPVYSSDGELLGVVGVDIEISDLSDFIASLQIGKSGKAFILDENGQVIAFPDRSKITHKIGQSDDLNLVEIGELEDEVSQAAYNAIQESGYDFGESRELFLTFDYNGEDYHAMFAPFQISYWPWLIGIYIPENDYIGLLKQNRTFTLSITVILGVLTGLIGFLITRSVVHSLRSLQDAAKEVSCGNLQTPIRIDSSYMELEETARVFEYMRSSLEDYSSHMESLIRKRTEELEQKNQELIDEVEQKKRVEQELIYARNRAEKSREAAEKAYQARNSFLANISHKIRTPLSGIIGYAELLGPENSDKVNNSFRDTILLESERLLVQINRLLDISKIESGQLSLDLKPFLLKDVVESSWLEASPGLSEKGLEQISCIEPDVPEILVGDPDLLVQILSNLLSNSSKFTESGSVSLSIETGINMNDNTDDKVDLLFTIKDTGQGMSRDQLSEISLILNRRDNSGLERSVNSGLGIHLVKELCDLMGGTVTVSSSESSGSCFFLRIPFRKISKDSSSRERKDSKKKNPFQFKDVKILLAEDYSVSRNLIRHHLEGTGCLLYTVKSGAEAVKLFREHKPDIVLMDILMSEMDGLEATRLIREEPDGPSTCIIGITANAFPGDLKSYWKAGMNDFLVKPFRKQDLFNKISHWESFSRMNRNSRENSTDTVGSVSS